VTDNNLGNMPNLAIPALIDLRLKKNMGSAGSGQFQPWIPSGSPWPHQKAEAYFVSIKLEMLLTGCWHCVISMNFEMSLR
jgi:hypothetical protein